jgi:signal transduction histidine kinase
VGRGEESAAPSRFLACRWLSVATAAALVAAGYGIGSWAPLSPAPSAARAGLVAGIGAVSIAWWVVARRARDRAGALARALEQRERTVAQRLDDLDALKTELIAVVSHEFRTPLTSLTGYARTLAARMDDLPRSAMHRCVSGIDHHATRLARLVHNVLAADGDVAVDPLAVTDVAVIARHAAEEALRTHDNRVVMRVDLPPALRARVDLFGAHRILGNLLDNAVKFAPCESVVRVSGRTDGDAAVVEVANRLDGRAVVDPARMFEPFVQAGSSETRRGEGLGLGLHVARRLTVAHGGELQVRAQGRTIVFRLRLPAGAARCPLDPEPDRAGVEAAALRS